MALKAGTVNQFDADSMAAAIENALAIEWLKFKGTELPDGSMRVYWRMLFVAIAQGVTRHLVENREAFRIHILVDQINSEEEPIVSRNNEELELKTDYHDGRTWIVANSITVSQISDPVASESHEGTIEHIEVVGELYGETP